MRYYGLVGQLDRKRGTLAQARLYMRYAYTMPLLMVRMEDDPYIVSSAVFLLVLLILLVLIHVVDSALPRRQLKADTVVLYY